MVEAAFAPATPCEGAFPWAGPERHRVRESRSALLWGIALPQPPFWSGGVGRMGLLPLAAYPLQIIRLGVNGGRRRASATCNRVHH